MDTFSEVSVLDLLDRFGSFFAQFLLVLRAEVLRLIAKLSSFLYVRCYLNLSLLLSEKSWGIATTRQLIWLSKSAMPVLR